MGEYVLVKSLPDVVQRALSAVDYHKKDIEVRTTVSVHLGDSGAGNGRRAFATLINLSTNQFETVNGSWGGQNMFNRENPVDNDRNEYPLPDNGAALTGSVGYHGNWATLWIPASMRERMLPPVPADLTDVEKDALYAHKGLKSGPYRKEYLSRHAVTPDVIDALVSRGLLNRNRAGAVSITMEGKNALGDYRGY